MSKVTKIFKNIAALPASIRLNFKYLPWRQAIRLPILIYGGRMKLAGGGRLQIDSANIRTGMIRLGAGDVGIYHGRGFRLDIRGELVFKGRCHIGKESAIGVACGARLELGDNFIATYGFRLACYDRITFGRDCLVGWNCLVYDTDFHRLEDIATGAAVSDESAPITVGDGCWLGAECRLTKRASLPPMTTLAAGTRIAAPLRVEPGSVVANEIRTRVVRTGVRLDRRSV